MKELRKQLLKLWSNALDNKDWCTSEAIKKVWASLNQ